MSYQEDFDQKFTPSQENATALVVIFRVMYWFLCGILNQNLMKIILQLLRRQLWWMVLKTITLTSPLAARSKMPLALSKPSVCS